MVEMKVLGSHEEWLRARTKIGGSDASAIFGMSPYKTNVELFKEKAYGIEPEDISDKSESYSEGVVSENTTYLTGESFDTQVDKVLDSLKRYRRVYVKHKKKDSTEETE